jgi:uroporphyrinogen-III synthase
MVVSTRILSSESSSLLENAGLKVFAHDFNIKSFTAPPESGALNLAQHVILTSVTGIQAFIKILDNHRIERNAFKIYCIEQETCAEALRQGLRVIGTAGNAALLADLIITHRTVRELTFICSNIRRHELPEKLRAADRMVFEWIGYTITPNPVLIPAAEFILFFSPSGIDSFLELNLPGNLKAVCIGETTAAYARTKKFFKVVCSDKSTAESVVNKVIELHLNSNLK